MVTGFSVATRLLSFIYKIIISRHFGAEAVGIFQMSVSFLSFFIALISSGLPLILSRKIAEQVDNKNEQFKKVSFALVYSVLLCLIITLVLIFSKPLLSMYFQNSKAISVFYILLPALMSTTVYSVIRAWLLGNKKFLSFSSTELLEEVLTILFTFILAFSLTNLTGEKIIALSVTIADVICIFVLIAIYFCMGGKIVKPTKSYDLIKSSLPITANRIVASLTGTFSAYIVPFKLIEQGLSESAAAATFGRFTAMCMPLISAPSALIGSLAIVLIPELSSIKNSNHSAVTKKVQDALTFSVLTAGFFVGIYLALGKEITMLVFNDSISGRYVTLSAVIIFPLVINQITTSILNTLNGENITLKNFIIGNIPMILIITFLTKYIGVLSLAVGFFVSFCIISLLNLIALNKISHIDLSFYKNMLTAILFCFICGYLIEVVSKYLPMNNLLSIIGILILYSVLYLALCFLCGLSKLESIKLLLHKK